MNAFVTTTFVIEDGNKHIFFVLKPEFSSDSYVSDRATIELTHVKKQTIVKIVAADAVALRAMNNGVCKTLAIYHKMNSLSNKDSDKKMVQSK